MFTSPNDNKLSEKELPQQRTSTFYLYDYLKSEKCDTNSIESDNKECLD